MESKIGLSENQLEKIKNAYKKKIPVTIQVGKDQLKTGKEIIFFSQKQLNKIEKCKKEDKGCRLTLTYDQLKQNHTGGFLPLIFAGLGALGALAGGASAIANTVINKKAKDKELEEQKRHDKVLEGKGLKKKKKSNR